MTRTDLDALAADLAGYEAAHAHLDADPGDWAARLHLADLCDDLARADEAACHRWMVAMDKFPHSGGHGCWDWFSQEFLWRPRHARLFDHLYSRLKRCPAVYPIRRLAEADLCHALGRFGLLYPREAA